MRTMRMEDSENKEMEFLLIQKALLNKVDLGFEISD